MDTQVLDHLISTITNVELKTDPFPYFFAENVFPQSFYKELLDNIPEPSAYLKLSDTGRAPKGSYPNRFVIPLEQEELVKLPFAHFLFWAQLSQMLHCTEWIACLVKKFEAHVKRRFGSQYVSLKYKPTAQLIQDHSQYSLGPHTDLPQRIFTLLFYFPETEEQKHLGTSIYRPKLLGFTCEGKQHHAFEDFIQVDSAPFLPNSVLGFFNSDTSFHGLELISEENVQRNLVTFFVATE